MDSKVTDMLMAGFAIVAIFGVGLIAGHIYVAMML